MCSPDDAPNVLSSSKLSSIPRISSEPGFLFYIRISPFLPLKKEYCIHPPNFLIFLSVRVSVFIVCLCQSVHFCSIPFSSFTVWEISYLRDGGEETGLKGWKMSVDALHCVVWIIKLLQNCSKRHKALNDSLLQVRPSMPLSSFTTFSQYEDIPVGAHHIGYSFGIKQVLSSKTVPMYHGQKANAIKRSLQFVSLWTAGCHVFSFVKWVITV